MAELAVVLASDARRASLLVVLRQRRSLTVGQLHHLVHDGEYADDLATITVRELLDPSSRQPPLAVYDDESEEGAIMKVFGAQPEIWLASSFFIRHMGLRRWTAQKLLGGLVAGGLLDRKGLTSSTRYRLARCSRAGLGLGSEE